MADTVALSKKRLVVAAIIVATSFLAIMMSLVLIRSTTFAIVVYTLAVSLSVLFIDPFLGLVNYIFFFYTRLQEFLPGFHGLPIILIIGGATFALVITHMATLRSQLALKNMPQHFLVVWFFLAIVVSNLSHGNLMAANLAAQSYASFLLLYFLIVSLLETERKTLFFLYHLLAMSLFLAGTGIYQYFTGRGLAGQDLIAQRIAWVGVFNDPNDLALALLMIMPFPIMLMLKSKHAYAKPIYLACAVALAMCVVFTESRGGILALGALIPFIVARQYGIRYAIIMGAVMAVGILVLGPSRMSDISTQEASAHERIESWTRGIDLFQSNPLFGVGAQQFSLYHFITAHNSLILAASELGLFGYFPWVFLFYISFKNLHFVQKEATERGWARLALMSESVLLGLVAWLSAGVFLSRTYSSLLFILFGLAAAVTGHFLNRAPERYVLVEKIDVLYAFLATLGSLFVLKVFLIWAW